MLSAPIFNSPGCFHSVWETSVGLGAPGGLRHVGSAAGKPKSSTDGVLFQIWGRGLPSPPAYGGVSPQTGFYSRFGAGGCLRRRRTAGFRRRRARCGSGVAVSTCRGSLRPDTPGSGRRRGSGTPDGRGAAIRSPGTPSDRPRCGRRAELAPGQAAEVAQRARSAESRRPGVGKMVFFQAPGCLARSRCRRLLLPARSCRCGIPRPCRGGSPSGQRDPPKPNRGAAGAIAVALGCRGFVPPDPERGSSAVPASEPFCAGRAAGSGRGPAACGGPRGNCGIRGGGPEPRPGASAQESAPLALRRRDLGKYLCPRGRTERKKLSPRWQRAGKSTPGSRAATRAGPGTRRVPISLFVGQKQRLVRGLAAARGTGGLGGTHAASRAPAKRRSALRGPRSDRPPSPPRPRRPSRLGATPTCGRPARRSRTSTRISATASS